MQQQQQQLNEKTDPFADNAMNTAPMNMQPVSPPQQMQQFPMQPMNPGPGVGAAAFGGAAGFGAGAMAANASRGPERAENPFGPQSELPPSAPGTSHGLPAFDDAQAPVAGESAAMLSPAASQLPSALRVSSANIPEADKAALAAGIGAAAGAGIGAAVASGHKSPENGPPSPTESNSSAAAAAKNNVHRVQLDFKPSMDDELELRAGDLVRLLHEYDDGWALCTRMDKSQQGVAPRTCLSASPVKPRPPPGASRPGPGPGPRMPVQRPESPAGRAPGGRNLTPNNGMSPNRGPGPYPGAFGPPRAGSPALGGPGMRNGQLRAGSPGPGMRNGPPRAGSPGPGMRNGPPRAGSPGPGMRNGPPRAGSPGPGMRNGPPRAGSPGPGMRNGPPRAMSPSPAMQNGPTRSGSPGPVMPGPQRQRSNSSEALQQDMRQAPVPGPASAGTTSPVPESNPASPKISRKPVGAES